MGENRFDIAVLGSGPGGYVAAIRAAQLGLKVCVVEKGDAGGTCLNRGCISSKSLVACVQRLKNIETSGEFGVEANGCSFDFLKMVERKDGVVRILRTGIMSLFKKRKIEYIEGEGRIAGAKKIEVMLKDGGLVGVEAEKIIIATGSEPLMIPQFNIDKKRILTSNEALSLDHLPKSMIIVGGGVLGTEFAGLFNGLGVDVTLVEAQDRLFPLIELDEEIIKSLVNIFRRSGIKIVIGKKIARIDKIDGADGAGAVAAQFEDGDRLEAEAAVVSVGRSLNSYGIGLEEGGIAVGGKGEIIVDDFMQTCVPGVYAIGDVTNKMQLAHVASKQGVVAVRHILGSEERINYEHIPWVIYTFPSIATIGLSEKGAIHRGYDVKCGVFNYRALGKARAAGETDGFVKVVSDRRSDRILGAHIIGSGAPEMIHEAALAVSFGATASELSKMVHAHPSFSEGLFEAFENIHDLGIHS